MQIKLNKATVYQCEGVKLVPGVNEVPEDAAKKLLANKLVKADIESGVLEVEKAKPGRKPNAEQTES